jgi:hypothetical protein
MFARPAPPIQLSDHYNEQFHHHPITTLFTIEGFVSRLFNYTMLGGTAPHVAGLFAGVCMGLGLDALVHQLDSHQFSDSRSDKRADHIKVGALLGSSTVLKNAWLQSWKSRHPYHWVSQLIMVLESVFSTHFQRQVKSSLGYIQRRSFKATRNGTRFLPLKFLRMVRLQTAVLVSRLSDPSLLRRRLGIKSMRNATFNFLDNGYHWFKGVPWVLPLWKKLYMPLLLVSATLRGTPVAARLHAGVLLRGQHKSFGWRAVRMLPGLAIDILLTSVMFFVAHTLLHSGHPKAKEPAANPPARSLVLA